jgi:hypothetical protein
MPVPEREVNVGALENEIRWLDLIVEERVRLNCCWTLIGAGAGVLKKSTSLFLKCHFLINKVQNIKLLIFLEENKLIKVIHLLKHPNL